MFTANYALVNLNLLKIDLIHKLSLKYLCSKCKINERILTINYYIYIVLYDDFLNNYIYIYISIFYFIH